MILVTGGGGFIGSHVCRLLATHSQDIVAVDKSFGSSLSYPAVQGDLISDGFLTELFHTYSFDAIIHLAALLNTASQRYPEQAMQVNVGSSLTLLRLAVRFNVPKFVFGSSISAYGPKCYADFGEVSESEPASPNNVYGVSKRYVEIVGEQYRQQGKIQFVSLRISMVVGAGAVNTASRWRSEIFEQLRAEQPTHITIPYAGHEIIPLIHVSDVAGVILQLINVKRTTYPLYNTPSENWKCGDLADYLGVLNRNIALTCEPSTPRGDPEAISGRRFTEEFGFQSPSMKERLRQMVEHGDA